MSTIRSFLALRNTVSRAHLHTSRALNESVKVTPKELGISRVGILGAGQMGAGIGLVASRAAKVPVTFVDSNPLQLEKSSKFLQGLLDKDITKGRLTNDEKEEILSRLTWSEKFDDFNSANFIIEAVSENVDLKRKLFGMLSEATSPDTILATNTSSISITNIAAASTRPEKVIGMHFMNPVPVMKLVEIIPGLATDEKTLKTTLGLSHAMGKVTTTSQDVPGFIANRLLMPYINEAVIALEQGIATKEDIDTTMKLGTNNPMGPLTLADFIGLDTCLAIMRVLHTELGDTKYRPAVLLKKYVDAGWLGKKSGRGFYQY